MKTAGFALPPAPAGGNRTTALRWARILRRLGWRAFRGEGWGGRPCDLLVALHARRSRPAVERFRRERPAGSVIVAATGTDLYEDLPGGGQRGAETLAGLRAADRIVVLQEAALQAVPPELVERTRVVHQSLPPAGPRPAPDPETFEVALLANLRPVKDPLLAARAVELLPVTSRLIVLHLGESLDENMASEAQRTSRENPRYRWLGPRPRREALCTLARARLALSTSTQEGGANAVSEAVVMGVPLIATDVPGTRGLLGADHPGLFPAGDVAALTGRLARAERDPRFLAALTAAGRRRAALFKPEREERAWRDLLGELFP